MLDIAIAGLRRGIWACVNQLRRKPAPANLWTLRGQALVDILCRIDGFPVRDVTPRAIMEMRRRNTLSPELRAELEAFLAMTPGYGIKTFVARKTFLHQLEFLCQGARRGIQEGRIKLRKQSIPN